MPAKTLAQALEARAPLPRGAVTLAREPLAARPLTARAADEPVRMPLALTGIERSLQGSQLRVITPGVGRISSLDHEGPTLELPAAGRAIVSSETGRASAAHDPIVTGRKTPLPWLLVETRRLQGGSSVRVARPFLQLQRAVSWDPALQRHVADVLFGLDREGDSSDRDDELSPPMLARFVVSCDGVTPDTASISKLGPAGYGSLRITCSPAVKNSLPQQFVEVHVANGNLRYPFSIPHLPGPLVLVSSSSDVLGFGLGTATLSVLRVEQDGSPLAADQDLPVELHVRGGSLDAAALIIPRGQSQAQVQIHPTGIGRLEVEALSGGVSSQKLTLQIGWPTRPVLAMLVGGALGGLLSALARRRKRQRSRRVLEGTLVGLLVTGVVLVVPAFAVLPAWARDTELGLFVLAALAGFAGTPLLDRATHAMFPSLRSDESHA